MKWYIDVPTRSVIRVFITAIAVIALALLMYASRGGISVIIIGGFLAVATHRPVTYIAHRLPIGGRKAAAAAVFLIIGAVAGFITYLVIPLIATQGRELISQIPVYIESLRGGDTIISQWLLQFNAFARVETVLINVFQTIVTSADITISIADTLIRNLIAIFFTIMIAFALVVEGPRQIELSERFLPIRARRHFRELRNRVFHAVTGFVNGRLIITTIAAVLTFVLLSILNVPAPLSLAAVIWLTGLIPLIGNTLGAAIVLLVALSQSLLITAFLLVYYVLYQQIENNVFDPIVQSKTVHLTPLTVLVSGIIGLMISGFLGALLAVPVGASLKAMIEYYAENRRRNAINHSVTG